jgi:hypothetical protein
MLWVMVCITCSPVLSYQQVATCVAGEAIAHNHDSNGVIGEYASSLAKVTSYFGDLNLMAAGPIDQCNAAANAVNVNYYPNKDSLRPNALPEFDTVFSQAKLLIDYEGLKEVSTKDALNTADPGSAYLFVYQHKNFHSYDVIADCVPGDVVAGLEQSGGLTAGYTVALQTIMPTLFGDLSFLGRTKYAGHCLDVMNMINTASTNITQLKKDGAFDKGDEDGVEELKMKINPFAMLKDPKAAILDAAKKAHLLEKGDSNYTYLYIFKNKMWNADTGLLTLADKESQQTYKELKANMTAWIKANTPTTPKPKSKIGQLLDGFSKGKKNTDAKGTSTTSMPTTETEVISAKDLVATLATAGVSFTNPVSTTAPKADGAITGPTESTSVATEVTSTKQKSVLGGLFSLFGKKKPTTTAAETTTSEATMSTTTVSGIVI